MTDQKLVDELEKALTDEAYDGGMGALSGEEFSELVRTLAVTAAEVVEKAHTPTDDEREAQGWREAAMYDGDAQTQDDFMTGWRTADRLRRSEVPEPSADWYDTHCPTCDAPEPWHTATCAVVHSKVPEQGEPSVVPTVQFVARGAGKSQALIESMLAQANERGIRVEVVYPQGEPSDAQVRAALGAWIEAKQRGIPDTNLNSMRAALRAASAVTEQGGAL